MKIPRINRITLVLLYLCLVGGILFIATLYWTLPYILDLDRVPPAPTARYIVELICWYAGSAGGIALILILIRMMQTISNDPFIRRNVRYMRTMGFIALGMAACSFLAGILYFSRPIILIIGMMETFCAMLSLVLGGVFEKAVEYHDENRLVI